ncbi:MAG: nucleoside deaminase [Acidimicrobiia bacterium]|nr:nucleoside deaminase [Acidimicrobiia bacterium]
MTGGWPAVAVRLPDWIDAAVPRGLVVEDPDDRMRLAIELARRNVEEDTGGPFGAAIFERDSGRLIAPGVNRVVPARIAVAHAEITAIAIAGQVVGSFTLGAEGMPPAQLVTSSEPCAMCFGAIPWSGVSSLLCGARASDAEAVGFDEGPKPRDWASALGDRGIEVVLDVLRDDAVEVLRQYGASGRPIYNG